MNPEPADSPETAPEEAAAREPVQDTVVGWLKAFALGIRDTWDDAVREGREASRKSSDARWARYESKTHSRRKKGSGG